MSDDTIHAKSEDFDTLIQQFSTASESYKNDLAKLYARIDDVTRRDVFSGATADVFIAKFDEKRPSFNGVIETIENFEDKLHIKKSVFLDIVETAPSRMN